MYAGNQLHMTVLTERTFVSELPCTRSKQFATVDVYRRGRRLHCI